MRLIAYQVASDSTNTVAKVTTMPKAWYPSWVNEPEYTRPPGPPARPYVRDRAAPGPRARTPGNRPYDQADTGRSWCTPSTQTSTRSSKKAISPAIFGCSGIGKVYVQARSGTTRSPSTTE